MMAYRLRIGVEAWCTYVSLQPLTVFEREHVYV